jgi:IS30 family transposase
VRGTNENTNGLIRQFFPKGTDLASIPERRFSKVQQLLNDRPRKRLGYRTPHEVLASCLKVAIETRQRVQDRILASRFPFP